MPNRRTPLLEQDYPDAHDDIGPMQLALEHLKTQMPDQAKHVRSIKPVGWLDTLIMPADMSASTDLFGNIRYRPESIQPYQESNDDLIAHEVQHAGQTATLGGKLSTIWSNLTQKYGDRPHEQEAYGVQAERKTKRRDVELTPERSK